MKKILRLLVACGAFAVSAGCHRPPTVAMQIPTPAFTSPIPIPRAATPPGNSLVAPKERGMQISLLYVGTMKDSVMQWWRADGTPSEPTIQESNSVEAYYPDPTPLPEDAMARRYTALFCVEHDATGSRRGGTYDDFSIEGPTMWRRDAENRSIGFCRIGPMDVRRITFMVPADCESLAVLFSAATRFSECETRQRGDIYNPAMQHEKISLTSPMIVGGKTVLATGGGVVSSVCLFTEGEIFPGTQSGAHNDTPTVLWSFPKISLKKITGVEICTPIMTGAKFQNVSLVPGKKTNATASLTP